MSKHIVSDALYMVQVWQTIKERGYEFVKENGDPNGIDFVANRIVEEAAQHSAQRTADVVPCEKHGIEYCIECLPVVMKVRRR